MRQKLYQVKCKDKAAFKFRSPFLAYQRLNFDCDTAPDWPVDPRWLAATVIDLQSSNSAPTAAHDLLSALTVSAQVLLQSPGYFAQ